jgi:hypothetical protein
MFSATNRTTVLGSPRAPTSAPKETMVSTRVYAPTSSGEITKVSRLAVRMPTNDPPNLPATAQMLPESNRRLSVEPLKRPPKTDDSERGRSSVTYHPSFCG